jgi:hypothetical protein
MDAKELIAALEKRGLAVHTTVKTDGVEGIRVSRPGASSLMSEVITVLNGIPHWSWGIRISGGDVGSVAALIDGVVSTQRCATRNSS